MKAWVKPLCLTILILSTLSGLLFLWQQRGLASFGELQDDGIYTILARSLDQGQGYRLPLLPGAPVQTKYPPLFPAALATLCDLNSGFPHNLQPALLLEAAAYLIVLGLLLPLFRAWGLTAPTAILLSALTALNPSLLKLSASVMTEVPFMALLLATIVLTQYSLQRSPYWMLAAGAAASMAYLTRTAALPLLITIPAVLLWKSRPRHALLFFVSMLPAAAGWQFWVFTHPSSAQDWVSLFYNDYSGLEKASVGWNNLAQVVYTNLDALLAAMGELLFINIGDSFLGHQFARLLAVGALLGAFRLSRRSGQWHFLAFSLLYCALLLIWHYPANQRFLLPLLPLLLAGLWTELSHLAAMLRQSWKSPQTGNRVIAATLAMLLAIFGLSFAASLLQARFVILPQLEQASQQNTQSLDLLFAQVRSLTPPNAIILTDQDTLLHLKTGRHSYRVIVPPPILYNAQIREIEAQFQSLPDGAGQPWDYALLTQADWSYALPESNRAEIRRRIALRPDLQVIYRNDFATLYRRQLSFRTTPPTPQTQHQNQ